MAGRRGRKAPLAILLLGLSIAWANGCGIDLSDELAGRPCKNHVCLPGYVCSEANTCVLDPGSGGEVGDGGSSGEAGTHGAGGSTEGSGGTGGSDMDATSDTPDVPDVNDDHSIDASGGTTGNDGSAGTSGTAGSAGSDSGPNRWPGVGCLQLTCSPAQICCVDPYPGYPTPPPATAFKCAAPDAAMCAFTLRCDGDHDCPAGQQCCVGPTAGGPVASCAANCANPSYRVECTKPEHCGAGLVCCGLNFALNRFESFLCRPSCNGFSDRIVCSTRNDCPAPADCLASAVLPGFKTCQP